MSLRLVCGRSGSGKSQFCLIDAIEKLNNNKVYIITPEQFSYSVEKKLIDMTKNGAILNAEVLTFRRMAYRVANEMGKSNKTNLSQTGKAMLIYSILLENKSKLKFLGKSEQNLDVIDRALTEFKKHNITLENLKQAIESEEDRYLKEKLNDLYYIYDKFENRINDKYIDDNDILTILANDLEHLDMFKDCIIYIDEFTGFTNQEYRIIEKLIKQAKQVTVTITTDNLDMLTTKDTDVFYSNKQTADKVLFLARKNNIECEKTVFLNDLYRFKNDELRFIEENIYNFPYQIYNKDVENIKLYLASNAYNEIQNVAKQIIKLVKYNDYRFKDIAVVTKQLDVYAGLTKAIFNSYDIPVFIDEKKNLSQNLFIKYIISLLDVYTKNWSYDSVINYIKSGFLKLDEDEIFLIENYCKKWGIKGSKWYNDEWNFGNITDENKEQMERIKELKNIIVEPLIDFKQKVQTNKTYETITKSLYDFLVQNEIDKKLIEKQRRLQEMGFIEISNEQSNAWDVLIEVFNSIIELFSDEKTTFDKYIKILKVGLNSGGLGMIPQTQDQVILGDIERSRSHRVKAVFVLGMNDGIYPGQHKDEGFLSDKDRNSLKEKGIELAKGSLDLLYEDNFSIYKAFTTAEEKLFLSYCSTNGDGSSLRPSILVNKIKKMFPKLKEVSDILDLDEEFITLNFTFEKLIENLSKFKDGEEIDKKWFMIYKIFEQNKEWNYKLDNAVKALNYTNRPEKISKENIDNLYGKTLNTTVSRLEQYKSCPFSYYLKYGLKVNQEDTFKIRPLDTGSFMHDVIDTFFKTIQEKDISINEIEDEQIEEIVSQIVEEKLQLSNNYIFTSTDKYKILTRRLKRVLIKSIKYITEGLKNSDFKIFGSELEFKKGKTYEPITLQLDNGQKVEITGKIDRIDLAKNENGNYIRIIDYKSSVKNIDLNEVVAGLQIQLLTYLDAACKIEEMLPAGILYFSLIDPIVKAKKHMDDEQIEQELKKKFKMNGIILADVKVVRMMDKELESGQSSVIPAYIDKEGNLSKQSNAITIEQFEQLQEYTKKIIKEISNEILSGNISLKPYYNIKTNKKPCDYCDYKMICQFKPGKDSNNYNYIAKRSKEEIFDKLKGEI